MQQVEETKRNVFCNVFSMGDAAYYAAAAAGIHPEAVLQIRKCAYNGERLVEFDGARLTVARVDQVKPRLRAPDAHRGGGRPWLSRASSGSYEAA